ncbi:Ig-like domain-containing protein [Photobacterium leiognathi]|uniref:Ig-like domain-containing protein n=1 Tax=Photobacterium leiognathi TaxID=553611 RepID=UPI002736F6B4|nr:Ig-like domain-containing protein [Photobacterium leiognathi]
MNISVKSLSPDASIYSGGQLSFAAEGIYSDGSKSLLTNKVTWYSSAVDIAQIDDKGILTGVSTGTIDVKASYEGIESNIINVRITDAILTSMNISVKSLSPDTSEASIYSGGKLSFAAEGIYSDGSTSLLTNKVTWYSSAVEIAQIDDKGILTGITIGTVEVKASYEGIESNSINVRITDAILTSMNISVKSLSPDTSEASIYSGGQLSFAAEGIYSDGSTSLLTNELTWHSSAIDIAQIDDKGILTGLNTGTVEVKASYEGIESNIINVRITDAILSSIAISVKSLSSEASIYSGGQLSFAAEGTQRWLNIATDQ